VSVHAFVDESARGRHYHVAAAVTDPARVRELRQSMRGLLMAGQRELHFKTEKDARRRTLADAIARLPVAVHVYSCQWGRHDEPARQDCLQRLAGDLITEGLQRLVIGK
jgi:hypothetical protein